MPDSSPKVGEKAPAFTVETTNGKVSLADLLKAGKLLLIFYTEDNTPLCTSEVGSFGEDYAMVEQLGARALAVSADSLAAHRDFESLLGGLPFPLASDADLSLARAFGVLDDSGKRSRRAIFVIDKDGTLLDRIDHYNPANSSQYEDVFRALGMDV